MKLTVKKQGEYGTTEAEGPAALALVRQTLRKISDHCILSTDDGFPEEVVVKAKGKIIGIIGADGTWEKVGDGPEQNPFEEKTDDQAKQP
jgi:hypothetical protein